MKSQSATHMLLWSGAIIIGCLSVFQGNTPGAIFALTLAILSYSA